MQTTIGRLKERSQLQ